MNRVCLLLVLFCSLGMFVVGCSSPDPPPTFEIQVTKKDDRIVTEFSKGQVVFDVHSETGIGNAEVKLASGQWPDKILLRIHKSGLESFKFSYPDTVVEVSLQSSGDKNVIRYAMQIGEELQSADEDTKFFMPVVRNDQEGWIEVQAPADFHELNPDSFRIDWIDFYR